MTNLFMKNSNDNTHFSICTPQVLVITDIIVPLYTIQTLTLSFCIHWPGGASSYQKLLAPQKSYWPEYCKQNMLLLRCPSL